MLFILGLKTGGLMEDPEWHIEHIRRIEANSLHEAKEEWARQTNHNDRFWNPEYQTYWGWSVVEVS